ncbi:MAG: AmmeMemoRadiSam system protein B, partial [Phycisphaerales bacterium]
MMYARHVLLSVLASITLASAMTVPAACAGPDESVRPAYCAGGWYPADATELAALVDKLISEAKPPKIDGKPIAIISPHAGYGFSAPTAAAAYASLRGHTYNRVIVMAFSHRYAGAYHGVEVPKDMTAYSTPLGSVPIDRAVCDSLLGKDGFLSRPGLDRNEHSLELQVPFLQKTLGNFKLVPLMVGQMTPKEYAAAAEAILPYVNDNTLLVASSDFTHYGSRFDYTPFRSDVRE